MCKENANGFIYENAEQFTVDEDGYIDEEEFMQKELREKMIAWSEEEERKFYNDEI